MKRTEISRENPWCVARMRPQRFLTAALLVTVSLGDRPAPAEAEAERKPLAFEVTYPPELQPAGGSITARVYVMLGPAVGGDEPRQGPDWFQPQPFFAAQAHDWKPGEPLRIDA